VLHDSLTPDEIVDSEAALEFMKEATKLASTAELESIGWRLEKKSALFQEILRRDAIESLDEVSLARLMKMMFSLKRKSKRVLRANGLAKLRTELQELLYGDGLPGDRLGGFVSRIEGVEEAMALSMASETLHFNDPTRHWLWTHWIWNPTSGIGALKLVVQEEVDLAGANAGEIYQKVGEAMAYVTAAGQTVGYSRSGRGLFGTDVFLACVYAVYMYTVFRVKLSQEFNRILPELPELVERVLGVHGIGEPNV